MVIVDYAFKKLVGTFEIDCNDNYRSICSDLVYVILFPQLLVVVHFKDYCNTYGSLAAYIVACVIRVSGGEPILNMPAIVYYPGYDFEGGKQRFPFRTMAMLMSLFTLVSGTWLSK